MEQQEHNETISLQAQQPEEDMFVRSQELQETLEYIQRNNFAVVQITGGAGFGKTTLAKAVVHKLKEPENERSVIFCSLLSKKTFSEVLIEMIHSIKTDVHLPENPEQWLTKWSMDTPTQFTFVLDNVDDILAFDNKDKFLSTLSAMREFSRTKGAFLVTSREELCCPPFPFTVVRLKPLSPEEATRLLFSRVKDKEIRRELCRTDKIAELCGYAPLALCIAGSLLSDCTEEKLVELLQENPLAQLEYDGVSVQAAIKTSFNLLTDTQKDAFVVMSVFPGTFDDDAAETVIEEFSGPGISPLSILRSLKTKSLIEQPRSRRYQLHPLICCFAKKVGESKLDLVLQREKRACAHFMNCLSENTKLFWSKDACKTAIESFHEERHNFEHFLDVYAKGMEKHDRAIAENCESFLDQFLEKCLFLQFCLTPSSYLQFLKRMLNSFTVPESDPVHEVELRCLLGHEMRKQNQMEQSIGYFKAAKSCYSKNHALFDKNAVSEVFYLNSYSDFLSKKGDRRLNGQVRNLSRTALRVCKERLEENHQEKAEALLLAGRFAKRMQDRPLAERKLKEGLELCSQGLGKHLMTVNALKENGDFFLSTEGDENVEKAFVYYQKAEEMANQIGMENCKEIIHVLKNYGVCEMKRGNYSEAMEYFEKAMNVAQRELKADHKWKVALKINQVLLLEKTEQLEKSKELMKEAVEMCHRLNFPFQNLGNSEKALDFINRHREEFLRYEFLWC